jgi:hypothetical protein
MEERIAPGDIMTGLADTSALRHSEGIGVFEQLLFEFFVFVGEYGFNVHGYDVVDAWAQKCRDL